MGKEKAKVSTSPSVARVATEATEGRVADTTRAALGSIFDNIQGGMRPDVKRKIVNELVKKSNTSITSSVPNPPTRSQREWRRSGGVDPADKK